MMLLLIPILIVAAGAGLYAAFTSRFWLIVLIAMAFLYEWGSYQQSMSNTRVKEAMKEVQTQHDIWAAQDALWAKQHH